MTTTQVTLLDTQQLAARWGVSVALIGNMRKKGTGPKFFMLNSTAKYKLSEVEAFENKDFSKKEETEKAGE